VKVGLLTLIVFAAVVVIICGVWVTIALIAELWPRKPAAHSIPQPDTNLAKSKTGQAGPTA
jgi:hypothetical protein